MRRAMAAFALSVGLPLSVAACLWDRDTPAEEAIGMPEVVAVLTGRFERNPPLYYEMRLARVTLHLQSQADDLAAYDDAGVACDRLGLGDEAISWMDRKRVESTKQLPLNVNLRRPSPPRSPSMGTFRGRNTPRLASSF
jgi:hypothetical protein